MWGLGGRFYWGRKQIDAKVEGIVVIFAWMSSDEKHVDNYVRLYLSLGWNSLVCHSQFLNMDSAIVQKIYQNIGRGSWFFPEKTTSLAVDILNELVEELKVRPCPVVLASFSGGPLACMFNILQIMEGKSKAANLDGYRLVRDSICGYIYDSSPVDFTSDLGTRFILHPSVLRISSAPRFASWIAHGVASGLDALFLSRFESQRAEYWQTLYATVNMWAPYLILCSENDDLAPYQVICNFVLQLKNLGADVKLVTWDNSPHVGHYRHHPIEYKAAVTELLGKAVGIYAGRVQHPEEERMGIEGSGDQISDPLSEYRKAVSSSTSFQGFGLAPADNFSLGSSEYYEGKDVGSVHDERKEGLIHLPTRPSINAHGVLGQILFDVCVPKNIEGWDISSSSRSSRRFASGRRHHHFNPMKCMRRSRL